MLVNKKGEIITLDLQDFQNNKTGLIACAMVYAQACGLNSQQLETELQQKSNEEAINTFRTYFADKINIIN